MQFVTAAATNWIHHLFLQVFLRPCSNFLSSLGLPSFFKTHVKQIMKFTNYFEVMLKFSQVVSHRVPSSSASLLLKD